MRMYRTTNNPKGSLSRFLMGRTGGIACVALLMLAALTQPAMANRTVEGVTAKLHVADVQVREGEDAKFVFTLSRALDFDIRYAYKTQDGTAKAGNDYVAENGLFVIPAGTRIIPLTIKTLKDNVIDKNNFTLVLSDPQTKGYGKVWGAYVWTDWWRVDGLPMQLTVNASIANVLSDAGRRYEPRSKKY